MNASRTKRVRELVLRIAGCIALASAPAWGESVIVVNGLTQQDIQNALNQLGGPGTVVVPAGRIAIEGTLRFRFDGVTLLGQGPENTVFFRETDGTRTSMVNVHGFRDARISGIRFEGVTSDTSNGQEIGVLLEDAASFRVDNSFFTHLGFAGVRTTGACDGVVDHCTFEEMFKPAVNNYGYGVVVYGVDYFEEVQFGSDRATFIEDSVFRKCRHAVSSNWGARYVFRFNTVLQNQVAHAVDAHGREFSGTVGTEWVDVHDNVIYDPLFIRYAVRLRGGKGVVWNNAFFGYSPTGIELTQDTPQTTGPIYIWKNTIDPETSQMVNAHGTMGMPEYYLSPPDDYVPYQYPHPLVVDSD